MKGQNFELCENDIYTACTPNTLKETGCLLEITFSYIIISIVSTIVYD